MLSREPSEHAAAFLLSVSLQTVQMRRQVVPARMSLWELARGVGRQVDLTVTVNILDVHGAFGTFLIIAALVLMLHPQKVRWVQGRGDNTTRCRVRPRTYLSYE